MIIKKIDSQKLPEYIIIGGGPAGITAATRLGRKNKSVLLIEAGGTEFDEVTQSHYKGKVIGDNYFPLDITRLRFLGGSSNHWGGNCAPLDKIDLAEWPINYEELKNFEKEAIKIFEIEKKIYKI